MNPIFGAPWDAPVCEGAPVHPIPVDERCPLCEQQILPGDQGHVMPRVLENDQVRLDYIHRSCMLRAIVGPGLAEAIEEELPLDDADWSEVMAYAFGAPPLPAPGTTPTPVERVRYLIHAERLRTTAETTARLYEQAAAVPGLPADPADTSIGPMLVSLFRPSPIPEFTDAEYTQATAGAFAALFTPRPEAHRTPLPLEMKLLLYVAAARLYRLGVPNGAIVEIADKGGAFHATPDWRKGRVAALAQVAAHLEADDPDLARAVRDVAELGDPDETRQWSARYNAAIGTLSRAALATALAIQK